MNNFANWITQTKNVYIGNATAVRDYRVQLRGNRSVLLFGMYLILLIGTAMITYSNTAHNETMSVVDAQRSLRQFYQVIMWLLAGVVAIVTPALSATAVVTERLRQSLDLVFSAPVSPRYYLVGKMISSYRYTWMLLVLSLPVTAACVVLGGASWSDVLVTYLLLSFHALIITSISLLLSTVAAKPVAAIIWSYAATGVYLAGASGLAAAGMSIRWMAHGSAANELPFYGALSPFLATNYSSSYSVISGFHVPNWILAGVAALLISKICLLGAGSLLAPSGGLETKGLRIFSLIYLYAIFFYGGGTALATVSVTERGMFAGYLLAWGLMPLILVLPSITCFGYDAERRLRPNGPLSLKSILTGTPGGALPYMAALILGSAAMLWLGGKIVSDVTLPATYGAYVTYTFGLWAFFWSVGRFASSFLTGIKAARTALVGAFMLLLVIPAPFLSAVAGREFSENGYNVWDLYVLRPILGGGMSAYHDRTSLTLFYGVVFLVIAGLVSAAAEANLRKQKQIKNAGNFAAA